MAGLERMSWDGRTWVRVWSRSAGAGRGGGDYDTDTDTIADIARAALTDAAGRPGLVHVRVAGQPDESVTLKAGVRWPLEQLAEGRAFSSLPNGGDVSEAKAAETWKGRKVAQMWSRGHGGNKMLASGALYHACCNGDGLHLFRRLSCEFHYEKAAPVEVWITCSDETREEKGEGAGTQIAQPEHMLEKMESSLGTAHQYSIGGDDEERHMIQRLDLWQQPQRGSLEEGNDLVRGVQMTLEAAMALSADSDAYQNAIGFCWHGAKQPESTVTVFLKDNNCSKDVSQRPRPSEACDVSLPAGVSAWHRAEEAVTDDDGRVCSWPDASGNGVTLVLPDAQGSAPSLVPASKTFPAYVRFAKCENEGLVYPDSFRLAGNDVAGNDENADLLQYSVFIVNRYYGSSPDGRTLQSRDTNWL